MLTSLLSSGVQVDAAEVERDDGPFRCPECTSYVTLKKGRVRVAHFAHVPPVNCEYGVGETEQHRLCKRELAAALTTFPGCTDVAIERGLDGARPDVSFMCRGVPVAVEVQRSTLTVAEIDRRTQFYTRSGIYVLWLSPTPAPGAERVSPKQWEKYCHSLYFGRVYHWHSGALVVPVHLAGAELYVEERTWREDGEERSAGGYSRWSKRYKNARPGPLCNVAAFTGKQRDAFTPTKGLAIPRAMLWSDDVPKWW